LQTFPEAYENAMPLCTMSQWGWHTSPLPAGLDPSALRLTQYDTHGRQVGYHTSSEGQSELFNWLRQNPHRLHLGRIGLRLLLNDGREAQLSDISGVEQTLDLWTGMLTSKFMLEGNPITVRTVAHPDLDLLAVTIDSALLSTPRLAIRFAFPYSSPEMNAADWNKPARHRSEITRQNRNAVRIHRSLETDEYSVAMRWEGEASFAPVKAHEFLLQPNGPQNSLAFSIAFSARPATEEIPNVETRLGRAPGIGRDFGAMAAPSNCLKAATLAHRN
jgi:hypothetical protein